MQNISNKSAFKTIDTSEDKNMLSKLILAYLILFNKHHPMKVAEMKRTVFLPEVHSIIVDNAEIMKSLSSKSLICNVLHCHINFLFIKISMSPLNLAKELESKFCSGQRLYTLFEETTHTRSKINF